MPICEGVALSFMDLDKLQLLIKEICFVYFIFILKTLLVVISVKRTFWVCHWLYNGVRVGFIKIYAIQEKTQNYCKCQKKIIAEVYPWVVTVCHKKFFIFDGWSYCSKNKAERVHFSKWFNNWSLTLTSFKFNKIFLNIPVKELHGKSRCSTWLLPF